MQPRIVSKYKGHHNVIYCRCLGGWNIHVYSTHLKDKQLSVLHIYALCVGTCGLINSLLVSACTYAVVHLVW